MAAETTALKFKIDGDSAGGVAAVTRMTGSLGTLKTAAAQVAAVLAGTSATGGNALDNLGKNADVAAGRVLAMSARVTVGLTAVAGILGGVARAGVDMNETVESATRGLTHITGSADAARAMIGQLKEEARTSAFEFKSLLPIAQQVAASWGPEGIGRTLPTLRAFSDAASVLGADIHAVERALLGFRQVIGSERGVQQDELNQLRDNLPGLNVAKFLKDRFGAADTETLQSLGITGRMAAEAILEGMQAEFGGAGRAAAGSLATVASGIQDTLNDLAGQVTDTFTGDVKAALGDFGDALSSLAQDKDAVEALKQPFDDLGQVVRTAAGAVSEAIRLFKDLTPEQQKAAVEAVSLGVKVGGIGAGALVAVGGIMKLVKAVSDLKEEFKAVEEKVGPGLLKKLGAIGAVLAALAAGIAIGTELNKILTSADEAEARAAEEAEQAQRKRFPQGAAAADRRRAERERAMTWLGNEGLWLGKRSNHDAEWRRRNAIYQDALKEFRETGRIAALDHSDDPPSTVKPALEKAALDLKEAGAQFGYLGCARFVTASLKKAGYQGSGSASSSQLYDQLVASGAQAVTSPQPGDVFFVRDGRGTGRIDHTGIVGANNTRIHVPGARSGFRPTADAGLPEGALFLRPNLSTKPLTAAEIAKAKAFEVELWKERVAGMPAGPARDREQANLTFRQDVDRWRAQAHKGDLTPAQFKQLSEEADKQRLSKIAKANKEEHEAELKRIEERTKKTLAGQDLIRKAKIEAMPETNAREIEAKALAQARFEHDLRVREAQATLGTKILPRDLAADLRAQFEARRREIQRQRRDSEQQQFDTKSSDLLAAGLKALEQAENRERRVGWQNSQDPEAIEQGILSRRPQELEKLFDRIGGKLNWDDSDRLLQTIHEARLKAEQAGKDAAQKAVEKANAAFDQETERRQLAGKQARDAGDTAGYRKHLDDMATRAEAEAKRVGEGTQRGVSLLEQVLGYKREIAEIDAKAAATDADRQKLLSEIAQRELEIKLRRAEARGDEQDQLNALAEQIFALEEQKEQLESGGAERKLILDLEEKINAAWAKRDAIGDRIHKHQQDMLKANAELLAQDRERAAAHKQDASEAERSLARRRAEREGPAALRAYLASEVARVRREIEEQEEAAAFADHETGEGSQFSEHARAKIAKLKGELFELEGKLDQFRPRWERFWRDLGQSVVNSLRGAFDNALTGLFEGLMGAKGRLGNVLKDLLSDLRLTVARALSSVVMEGAESLIRGGMRSLFRKRNRNGDEGGESGARGEYESPDTENQETGSAAGSGEGTTGGKRSFGQMAAAAGLAVSGLLTFVGALKQGKDGLGSAVPMMIAALVQLVLAFMVAKQQIAAGPAGMLAGAVIGLASLFGGKHADGGRPAVGKLNLVGERGPELFVPDVAGEIIPNHVLAGLRFGFPGGLSLGLPHPAGRARLDQPLRVSPNDAAPDRQRTHHDNRAVNITNNFYGPVGDLGEVRRHENDEYDQAWMTLATEI